MAGGAFVAAGADGGGDEFEGRVTIAVVLTCIMAASGGLIFGYDVGISGGVTTMAPFLEKFFPDVLKKMRSTQSNVYCNYDSQILTAFTSSLYIAGLLSSLVAGRVTQAVGRRVVMLIGGALFFFGSALNAAALNIEMLILGRILLGFGVGFTNQAAPLYLVEVAPPRWRGAFNTGFQFFLSLGVLVANLTNYFTSRIDDWGWRLSLGLAAVPGAILFVGAIFIPDTPSSLAARGDLHSARVALQHIRGSTANIDMEFKNLVQYVDASRPRKGEASPLRKIVRERRYRQHLVMAIMLAFFQQMTGVNIIAFYAPVFFQTVGFGSDSSLMAAVILGAVNLVSTLLSAVIVDKYGRKVLFLQGGVQMGISLAAVASILAAEIGTNGSADIPKAWSTTVLVLMCVYSAGFGWSWGPLIWLVPSEIFPVEIRSAGQSINVSVNFAITFVLAQTFLSMLCHFKFGTFLFYAGWLVIMTVFVMAFLPETKGVPLESMNKVWEHHWYWGKRVGDIGSKESNGDCESKVPNDRTCEQ